jgi:hypothetical protein
LRKFKSYLSGILTGIAIFIICNCAGYLIITYVNTDLSSKDQSGSLSPSPQAAVAFVTETFIPEPDLSTSDSQHVTPLPLLPTITPGASLTGPLPPGTAAPPATATPLPVATATPPATQVAEIVPTRSLDPDQLQILSHQSYVDSLGWYHIVGEVQNNSDVPVEFVEVIAKLYDETNNVIGTKLTFTAPDTIFPSGKAPFDIITLRRAQWQKINDYQLQVKGDPAATLLPQNLVLLNQSSRIQGDFLYVAGEVQNTGSTPALVKLIITLYDTSFNVVNTDWGYANGGVIPANETSAFEVRIAHQTDRNNYHYRIQIQEEAIETD